MKVFYLLIKLVIFLHLKMLNKTYCYVLENYYKQLN